MNTFQANNRQVGGDHYRADNANYQHWDLVADTGMGYFEGVLTKYVCRYKRAGNSRRDLEKALHYCEKLIDLTRDQRQRHFRNTHTAQVMLEKFVKDQPTLGEVEIRILKLAIFHGSIDELKEMHGLITSLLELGG